MQAEEATESHQVRVVGFHEQGLDEGVHSEVGQQRHHRLDVVQDLVAVRHFAFQHVLQVRRDLPQAICQPTQSQQLSPDLVQRSKPFSGGTLTLTATMRLQSD
jgi:hypothetical protein